MATNSLIIEFMLNPYAPYPMALLELRHINNRVEACVEASPEVWETIDLLMFFNLRLDIRNTGSISGTKSVQIKMVLDPKIYKSLESTNELITDQKIFKESPSEHPMRGTASWFALEVTEEIDLPESLKALGDLREGFTTKWKEDFQ